MKAHCSAIAKVQHEGDELPLPPPRDIHHLGESGGRFLSQSHWKSRQGRQPQLFQKIIVLARCCFDFLLQ